MLKFKNNQIEVISNFLQNLPLKNKASRARTLLISKLSEKLQEYVTFQKELLDKFAEKDEAGKLIQDSEGNYHWQASKVQEANEAMNELGFDEVFINLDEYRPNIENLTVALAELDIELSGQDALIYNELMNQLEAEIKGEQEHD